MKKFKYKVGEVVYFFSESYDLCSDYRELLITDRLVIEAEEYYKCVKIIRKWNPDKELSTQGKIVKLDLFTLDVKTLVLNNLPLTFEYIPVKFLFKKEDIKIDVPECGNNGCEIITNLLEEKEIEISEEDKKIVEEIEFYNKGIERSQTLINSYGDAIYALQKSIEEECININKLKNKIAVLTRDDFLYASTFIDTIED